ncbi:Sex-regulated protein janus-A [Atta colombica]|uniref:Sex-regulated protein janus-A n=1 Tax=Atta colombica TaxID=520822 RepID=A0A195AWL5_9HYME|nr:Sex-regulated protein janus-A [Atta colombica]
MPLMAAILKFGLTSGQSSRQLALRGIRRFVKMSQLLDKVPDVDIDGHGRFKYILVNVQDDVGKTSKKIVRGYARAQWHGESKIYILNLFFIATLESFFCFTFVTYTYFILSAKKLYSVIKTITCEQRYNLYRDRQH